MNIIKNSIASAVIAVVAVLVGFSIYHPSSTNTVERIAGGTTPEVSSPYFIINGVTNWYYTETMRTATTSLCTFQAPTGTSTLEYVSFHINQATTTAALIDIATSTNNFGTTTANSLYLTAYSLPAGSAQGTQWNGAAGNQSAYLIYSPASAPLYVNVLTEGAGQNGYTIGGTCSAVFDSI